MILSIVSKFPQLLSGRAELHSGSFLSLSEDWDLNIHSACLQSRDSLLGIQEISSEGFITPDVVC